MNKARAGIVIARSETVKGRNIKVLRLLIRRVQSAGFQGPRHPIIKSTRESYHLRQ